MGFSVTKFTILSMSKHLKCRYLCSSIRKLIYLLYLPYAREIEGVYTKWIITWQQNLVNMKLNGGALWLTHLRKHFVPIFFGFPLYYYCPFFTHPVWNWKVENAHTHTPHTPACKRLQTRTTGMDPPTEDTRFLIHHYSTVDIMWLFTTQLRTSSYTPNRGHGLNSIFTSFSSSCTPPPANRGPSTVWNASSVYS